LPSNQELHEPGFLLRTSNSLMPVLIRASTIVAGVIMCNAYVNRDRGSVTSCIDKIFLCGQTIWKTTPKMTLIVKETVFVKTPTFFLVKGTRMKNLSISLRLDKSIFQDSSLTVVRSRT
ncbi:6459_t:CDS:2, partial [Funneliformis caledonium]